MSYSVPAVNPGQGVGMGQQQPMMGGGGMGLGQQQAGGMGPGQSHYIFLNESMNYLKGMYFKVAPQWESKMLGMPDTTGRFYRFAQGKYRRGLEGPINMLAKNGYQLVHFGRNKGYNFAVMRGPGAGGTGQQIGMGGPVMQGA